MKYDRNQFTNYEYQQDLVSTTIATIVSSSATRRPFRVASRRRLPSPTTTTTTTTTSQPTYLQPTTSQTTSLLESEELLQDIGDIDAIEDPSLEPRSAKIGSKTPRRPLVNLKEDQNASATNDEERRRQSKKYSSSFKQNQLEDILKKNDEVTTEAGTTFEDNAAAALALVAHQLITAPLPSTDDSTRNTAYTASEYTKTPAYAEYTTAYRTAPEELGQTTVGETYSVYDTPRVTADYTTDTARSGRPDYTADYATKTTYDVPKTTSLRSSDRTDIDTGKATFETFPSTVLREEYTNTPTEFSNSDVPKLSTTSRYPTTPAYQTVTNQYVPSTFDYTTIRGYTDTSDLRSYSTPRTIAPRGFSSPNVITSGFTGIQRGGFKFENEKYATDVPTNTGKYTTIPVEDRSTRIRYSPASDASRSTVGYTGLSLSSPNVITSGYTGLQRGGVKYENDKFSTVSEVSTNTAKYTTIPVEDRSTPTRYTVSEISGSTVGYTGSSQEPAGFFTREYLLESPVTKTYDDEYQYLSPTTPQTSTRKVFRKKIQRRISTTIRPTTSTVSPARLTTPTYVPEITSPKSSSRSRIPTKKPFEKIAKVEPNRTYKPVVNYDYYEDSQEKIALKYAEGTKVILHGKGSIECLDVGNFPHPSSCKKFISCARMEFGAFLGWEYVCPKGLSFDPVGGICNWSAGLGCDEKDKQE